MNLLVMNLATDADDPILGFTTGWLRALAALCARIDVVTMRAGRIDLPDNVTVHSVGKERGYSEPRRAVEFYRVLVRLLKKNRYDACFAHMMPLFVVLGGPVLRARRIPIVMWYAHRSVTRTTKIAERFCTTVLTSTAQGFRIPSNKVKVIGQGIDTATFSPADDEADPSLAVCVGRLSPIKHLDVAIDAAALVHERAGTPKLRLVGPTLEDDGAYVASLKSRVAAGGLNGRVEFTGPRRPDALVAEYRTAGLLINSSPTGALDKVVLEAMACGTPAVVGNRSFSAELDESDRWLVCEPTPEQVAGVWNRIEALSPSDRAALGRRLRAVVERRHSLDKLADRIVAELEGARR